MVPWTTSTTGQQTLTDDYGTMTHTFSNADGDTLADDGKLPHGFTSRGAKKVIDNQVCLDDKVSALSAQLSALDSEGVVSRVAASEARAADAASAAQASATVAGGAEEITQAAAPVLQALEKMQAQLGAMQAQLGAVQTKSPSVAR